MEIIIEDIGKDHKLIGRHKYAQAQITIGRAYTNDIIISDPHVCPEHVSLCFDGEQWLVIDQHSINGTFLGHSKKNANHHIVQSGDVISIGNSQIRLVFPDHPVAPSVAFSPFETLIDLTKNPFVIAFSIILFTLASGWLTYLDKAIEVNFTQLLVPAVGMTLMFGVWPAVISLISHLTKNDARVLHQVGTCFVFFIILMLSDIVQSLVGFNTSSNWPIVWLINLLPIAIAFCMFWLNCYIGFHMSDKRRLVTAACLTLVFFGGSALVQISKQPDFNPRPQYSSTIMPPSFLWVASSDVDSFLGDAEKLFEKTQKAVAEEKE
ncbi:FHA domain-containing protein [Colwellia sp. MEBiC06753]